MYTVEFWSENRRQWLIFETFNSDSRSLDDLIGVAEILSNNYSCNVRVVRWQPDQEVWRKQKDDG